MRYGFIFIIICTITISGCNYQQQFFLPSEQRFSGPSEQIDISYAEEYDPEKKFQFMIKCSDEIIKYFMGKDAGYGYYNSNGKLIEYCGKYAKNLDKQKCDELRNKCPS